MMKILLKVISSEIMYYVVIPIAVVLLGWLKSGHDLKEKNKELGYWVMKCRRFPTFQDLIMKSYKMISINLFIMLVIRFVLEFWKGIVVAYIISGILYLGLNALFVWKNCRGVNGKIEFMKNAKEKGLLTIALYAIYAILFFLDLFGKYIFFVEMVWIILLIVWAICLFNSCDVAFVLDNKYADIYVKGSERAQFAEAGSIKKYGEWIMVNRYVNGYAEEIRIKESDIVRIDYYGGPMIMIEIRKLFQKRHR